MILVDTGYLIGLGVVSDQLHGVATRWSAVVGEPLLVTEYVLLETLNALSHPYLRRTAAAIVNRVRTDPQFEFLPVGGPLFDAGLDRYRSRPDKGWSLTDCVSFHVMAGRGIGSALTYDHHFQQAGFEPLLRREP